MKIISVLSNTLSKYTSPGRESSVSLPPITKNYQELFPQPRCEQAGWENPSKRITNQQIQPSSTNLSSSENLEISTNLLPKQTPLPSQARTSRTFWNVIANSLTHRPHPMHDQKYTLALETQRRALHNFLSPKMPCDFLSDLQKESPLPDSLKQHVIDAVQILLQTTPDVRKQNFSYLFSLRKALKSREKNQQLESLLHALCWSKFMDNHMTSYEESFLNHAISPPPDLSNFKTLAQTLHQKNDALAHCDPELKKAPQDLLIQKGKNELGIASDPLGSSNIPEVRSIHRIRHGNTEKEISYLRHGTVTLEEGFTSFWNRTLHNKNTVEIVPEYRGFLKSAQEKNKKVLYVNHQNMCQQNSAEYNRSKAIQDLQKDYPNTFIFMTMPFDGPLLKKTSEGTLTDWIQSLLYAFEESVNGVYFPKKLYDQTQFQQLANQILNLFFRSKTDLNAIEWTTFVLLFYSYVKEIVKAKYQIDAMVTACKDNKDRGNVSAGVDEALFTLRLGREENPQALNNLYIKTLAPFIIKYEEILPHRLNLLLNVLHHLEELNEQQKEAIRNYSPIENFEVLDHKVDRETVSLKLLDGES